MLLALGAASSAIDALQALTSSKSSSAKSAGARQQGAFDFFSGSTASAGPERRRKRRFADFAGDHERAVGRAKPVLDRPLRANQPFGRAEGPVLADRRRWRRQDHQIRIRKGARRRRHQLAKADDVFSKLDKNGDGSVSLDEMSQALKGGKGRHHRHHHTAGGLRRQWLELRSADAGAAGRLQHLGHQQRRFDDDIADLCGRIEGHDDVAGIGQFVERRDLVLQFHRADDPAPGQGDLVFGQPLRSRSAPEQETRCFGTRPAFLFEHDLFGKPVPTFPDHALAEAIPPRR